MKLNNLTSFEEALSLAKLSDISSRYCWYYWILLLIPSTVIYFTKHFAKTIFIIPMILTAVLIPHGQKVSIQSGRIKNCSFVLIMHILIHAMYQYSIGAHDADMIIFELIGIVGSIFMYVDANSVVSVESTAVAETDETVEDAFYALERLSNVLQVLLITATSVILKYQPLVLVSATILENGLKALSSKYFNLIRILSVGYALIHVVSQTAPLYNLNSQFATILTFLLACFILSKQALLKIVTGTSISLYSDKFSFSMIRSSKGFVKDLKQYPNIRILLDKGWPLVLPIPFLLGIWKLSAFKTVLEPSFVGLLSVLVACSVIVHVYWDLARFYIARTLRLIAVALLIVVLYFDSPSADRQCMTLLVLSLVFLCTVIEGVYRIIAEESRRGELSKVEYFYLSGRMGIIAKCLRHSWDSVSPFISAGLITYLTLHSLNSNYRLIIMGFALCAALFARSEVTIFWFLIESYVIIEQAVLLFIMQKNLPAALTKFEIQSVLANAAIIVLAELQRLRFIPSIFREVGDKSRSQVHSTMPTEEKFPEENETFKEDVQEYKNSLLWTVLTGLGRFISVFSVVILMGVLLFYPQLVDVSFETCVYSVWAALFVFLFYRPKVTTKLRFYFIGVLALLSGVFFLKTLYEMMLSASMEAKTITSNEEKNMILHAAVFWLSCCSIFVMDVTANATEPEPTDSSVEAQNSPIKSLEASPAMLGAKLVQETGAVMERLFVVYWTRSCALLAFLAASFNPSIFGAVHLLIGCSLVWKNILSPALYVPMILWLLCATFLPAILSKFIPQEYGVYLKLLVGTIRTTPGTVCLTAWALILFMQPLFMRFLLKLTTERERQDGLVNFQVLPVEAQEVEASTSLTEDGGSNSSSLKKFETFENSIRYYLSNWFLEFHNEIMVAALIIVTVTRKNVYGSIYALLTLLHVVVPMIWKRQSLKILAKTSFTLQMICFLSEYCMGFLYPFRNIFKIPDGEMKLYEAFFGLTDYNGSLIVKSIFSGAYILLTVRWYLTSSFYQQERPDRRFDTHWCRLCNRVSFKSKHAYSRVKHNIHLYLGWAAHAVLFMTAITAYKQPTLPAVFLLILALIFFFYGEASILMPNLRNQVYLVLGILLFWTLSDSILTGVALLFIRENGVSWFSNEWSRSFLCYLGLTNFLNFWNLNDERMIRELVFESYLSRFSLGLTVFLVLLQIRLYQSKAWPFVLARMYHSYATAAKRAQIFNFNLQATISFQQKNLEKAAKHVKRQMASFKSLDISDWKKLCYVPPEEKEELLKEKDTSVLETEMPIYGTSTLHESSHINSPLRQRSITEEFRTHLNDKESSRLDVDSDHHLDQQNTHDEEVSLLNLKETDDSGSSMNISDAAAKLEKLEIEKNFYWYTFIASMRSAVKILISSSQDYRRLQKRPSQKTSLKILFHHQSVSYRVRFLAQLVFDVINSNFDYVIDFLVMEAQVFHYSGFSLFMVIGTLLLGHLQRPYTSKRLHNRLIVLCALWILLNYCKVIIWKQGMEKLVKSSEFFQVARDSLKVKALSDSNRSFLSRLLGIHIFGSIGLVTLRPTIILLALSYKRSLMRHLGLWDYGQGIEMARIYYQTEEDLDEIDELNVPESDLDDSNSDFSIATDTEDDEGDGEQDVAFEHVSSTETTTALLVSKTWSEILVPTIKMPWRDFYVAMFVSDFACLFIMMVYWGEFTLGPIGATARNSVSFFSEMVNQNMIPAALVNMVLLSTFILVLDRALYVSKNFLGKFLLQLITLLGYHAYFFFYLPEFYTHSNIASMFGFKLWYASKWVYWISSALQLKYNFPPLRTEPFLGSQYGIVSSNLHTMYRSIPFIEELKTIIDWSMTPSALGLWPWLKFADIFERLYAVQCARAFQGTYYGRHRFGMPFNQFSKIGQGIVVVTLSILVLWSPFLILSRESMMAANNLASFKLEVSLGNHGPAFLSFSRTSFESLSREEYDRLRYANGVNPFEVDPNLFTKITLPAASQIPWTISEFARREALKYLTDRKNFASAELKVNWTITRAKAQPEAVLLGSKTLTLSQKERDDLALILDPSTDETGFTVIRLSKIIPTLMKAPLTEKSTELESRALDYHLIRICPKTPTSPAKELRAKTGLTGSKLALSEAERNDFAKKMIFFKEEFQHDQNFSLQSEECQFFLKLILPYQKTDDKLDRASVKFVPIDMFVYSSKLPKYSFSSFNLVGLYATVVFTVAQLFRMMHADMTTRIQYDDLPNPAPLLVMCQQILMMRELGDFTSEEAIYWQLIEILRNPQILIEITKKQ